jgi:hypothetical protein
MGTTTQRAAVWRAPQCIASCTDLYMASMTRHSVECRLLEPLAPLCGYTLCTNRQCPTSNPSMHDTPQTLQCHQHVQWCIHPFMNAINAAELYRTGSHSLYHPALRNAVLNASVRHPASIATLSQTRLVR